MTKTKPTARGRSVPAGRISSPMALQFLINCWLSCLEELPALAVDPARLPTRDRPRRGMKQLQNIETHLQHLVGDPLDEQYSPLHGGTAGILPRLWLLARQLPNAQKLGDACRNALTAAQLAVGKIAAAQTHPRSELKSREAAKALEKIQQPTARIHRLLIKELTRHRDDENVVFFLVRNAKQIDGHLGAGTTVSILEQMFSGGTTEVRDFLEVRYRERGFEAILPNITATCKKLARHTP